MAHIFISYARQDKAIAQSYADVLQAQGWPVWWDRDILPGQHFDRVIEKALQSAGCVIVLWSRSSVESDWVKDEAADAANRNILIPVLIEDLPIPLGFRRIQTLNLTQWDGKASHPQFQPLLAAISTLISKPSAPISDYKTPDTPSAQPHPPQAIESVPLPPPPKRHLPKWIALLVVLLSLTIIAMWRMAAQPLSLTPTSVPQRSTYPAAAQIPTTPPVPQGQIAFYSYRSGGNQIYVMSADGTSVRQLTNSSGFNVARSWSPDGKSIAFASTRDGNWEVYVMNSDGSNQRNLTNNPASDYDPILSPDGKLIAFTSNRDGNAQIYVMDTNGENLHRFTKNRAKERVASWSPDGHFITFYSDRDGNLEVYVMAADGSNQRNLTNNSGNDDAPKWSPDGRSIVFRSLRDGNTEIYAMNADGSNQHNLTNNPASDDFPSWSPDGHFIVFTSNRNGSTQIYIMNADGSNAHSTSSPPIVGGEPAWSPQE